MKNDIVEENEDASGNGINFSGLEIQCSICFTAVQILATDFENDEMLSHASSFCEKCIHDQLTIAEKLVVLNEDKLLVQELGRREQGSNEYDTLEKLNADDLLEQKPKAAATMDGNCLKECTICFDECIQESNGWTLSCHHIFCIECIKHAVSERMIPLVCAQEACLEHVQPEAIHLYSFY